MKFTVAEWPLERLYSERNRIDFPVYQRGDVWEKAKRQRLIDSIFRGIDIPKIYLQKHPDGDAWDCIDGHQRIDAIVSYFDDDIEYDGKTFLELAAPQQENIKNYKLTVVEVTEISDLEVRDLFERLQLGIPLNSGEKLNAIMSKLGDFIKNDLSKMDFVQSLDIPERRFAKEQLCAQICNNSKKFNKSGQFLSSKYEDLSLLYRIKSDFDKNSEEAKFITNLFGQLNKMFRQNAHEIKSKANAVSLYLLVEEMTLEKTFPGNENLVGEFYLEFLKELEKEAKLGIDISNRFLKEYQKWVIQGADSKTAITERHNKLKEAFQYYIDHKTIIKK